VRSWKGELTVEKRRRVCKVKKRRGEFLAEKRRVFTAAAAAAERVFAADRRRRAITAERGVHGGGEGVHGGRVAEAVDCVPIHLAQPGRGVLQLECGRWGFYSRLGFPQRQMRSQFAVARGD
jgi:hypothetical protein